MSDPSPYQPPVPLYQSKQPVDAETGASGYPLEFERKSSAGWQSMLQISFGILLLCFGFLMFAVHLFLIDSKNQLAIHAATTLPIIMGTFSPINGWNTLKTPAVVRLWEQEIQIEGSTSQKLSWDEIEYATVVDAVGGTSKKLRLLGHGGTSLATISSGVNDFKTLSEIVCKTVTEKAPKEEHATIQSKRGRRMAYGAIALGLGMLVAGAFIIYDGRWSRHAQQRLAEEAVAGKGTVTRHFVAPNGRTKRIEYEIEGDNGESATHNVEVESWLHESIQAGDVVDVGYVPDDPSISELAAGEIASEIGMGGPIGSMLLGIAALVMSLFAFAASVMFWKGYDLKYEDGKFRFAPV